MGSAGGTAGERDGFGFGFGLETKEEAVGALLLFAAKVGEVTLEEGCF